MIQNSLLPSQFFTIGYEGLGIKRFLEILKENQVKTLVDVRHNPYSMNKDFIRKFLIEHLEQNGIKYEHLKDWGIPSKIRKEGSAMEWYVQNVKPNISKNISEGLEQPVCFMCMENDIGNCHRQVILETLRGQGLDGRDLAPKLDPKQATGSKPKISSGWDEDRFFKKPQGNYYIKMDKFKPALDEFMNYVRAL